MSVWLRLIAISVAWVALQIGAGFVAHRIPRRHFTEDRGLFRTRGWEDGGRVYDRVLRVRRWKDLLPEAGAMFAGGFSKRHVGSLELRALEIFIAETRRAEFSHWFAVILSLTFFVWNPPHVAAWMPGFGLVANAPFIVVQRYLRPRLQALAVRRQMSQ